MRKARIPFGPQVDSPVLRNSLPEGNQMFASNPELLCSLLHLSQRRESTPSGLQPRPQIFRRCLIPARRSRTVALEERVPRSEQAQRAAVVA